MPERARSRPERLRARDPPEELLPSRAFGRNGSSQTPVLGQDTVHRSRLRELPYFFEYPPCLLYVAWSHR